MTQDRRVDLGQEVEQIQRGRIATNSQDNESGGTKRTELAQNTRKKDIEQIKNKGLLWTTTKQSMSYITVAGIRSDTSWQERDWPKESMKELISNAYDSHREAYPNETKETRKIAVPVRINPISDGNQRRIIIRITVRNSNVDNITVFDDLQPIFDYDQFYSPKRH